VFPLSVDREGEGKRDFSLRPLSLDLSTQAERGDDKRDLFINNSTYVLKRQGEFGVVL
jgi:hypothetical protein